MVHRIIVTWHDVRLGVIMLLSPERWDEMVVEIGGEAAPSHLSFIFPFYPAGALHGRPSHPAAIRRCAARNGAAGGLFPSQVLDDWTPSVRPLRGRCGDMIVGMVFWRRRSRRRRDVRHKLPIDLGDSSMPWVCDAA